MFRTHRWWDVLDGLSFEDVISAGRLPLAGQRRPLILSTCMLVAFAVILWAYNEFTNEYCSRLGSDAVELIRHEISD
jgi:hypothetical protein